LIELAIRGSQSEILGRYLDAVRIEPIPDVAVFPELFTTGYVLGELPGLALRPEDIEKLGIAETASDCGLWVVAGTFPVRTKAGLVNRLHVFSPEGSVVFRTEKAHLFKQMGEDEVFTPGRPDGIVEIHGVPSSAIVCYDLRFPELSRKLALQGAELVYVPAQWPAARTDLFRCLLRARAAEAQVFYVGCNLGGEHLGVDFGGGGGVAHPSGRLLDGKGVAEGVTDFDIAHADVRSMREKLNCLEDRRPEVY
jgi:predicted amidohydrolase